MSHDYTPDARRPIATRDLKISHRIANRLAEWNVSPNLISTSSILFGAVAGVCAACTPFVDGFANRGLWLGVALGVQLRLLANLFDGMVALASKKASPVGELYNEIPDRVSDTVVFLGLGFAAGGNVLLGALAALASILTAYVRVQGALINGGHHFIGPMAKPHRMFLVTLLGLFHVITPGAWQDASVFGLGPAAWVCLVVFLGALLTAARRIRLTACQLRLMGDE